MTRISLLLITFACFTFLGCGGEPGSVPAPDEAAEKETTPIEEDLKSSGMEGMTEADYLKGGKQE